MTQLKLPHTDRGWWYRPSLTHFVRRYLVVPATSNAIHRGDEWAQYEQPFCLSDPEANVYLHEGDFLVKGMFERGVSPEYALALAQADQSLLWLHVSPRAVQVRLRRHGIKIEPGRWQALRGAMILAQYGGLL